MTRKIYRFSQFVPSWNTSMMTEWPEFPHRYSDARHDATLIFHASCIRMKQASTAKLAEMEPKAHRGHGSRRPSVTPSR